MMRDLNLLNKEELVNLINIYDKYIQNTNNEDLYREGWYPVCIEEFYKNDFEIWKEN